MSPELVEEKPYDHTADLWCVTLKKYVIRKSKIRHGCETIIFKKLVHLF